MGDKFILLQDCIFNISGSQFVGSISNNIQNINQFAPELAYSIEEGMIYPELTSKLDELAQEIVALKSAKQESQENILETVGNKLDTINKIAEGVDKLKPYVQGLYGIAKTYLQTHYGLVL